MNGGQNSATLGRRIYLLEYLYCILFFMVLFVVLSVASFHPNDPTSFNLVETTRAGAPHNLFGPIGATTADWLIQFFGVGAFIFGTVFLLQILDFFAPNQTRNRFLLKLAGYPQLLICYLGLLCVIAPTWWVQGLSFPTGGMIGAYVAQFFIEIFGEKGAAAALFFAVVASLPLCLGIRPIALISTSIQVLSNLAIKMIYQPRKTKKVTTHTDAQPVPQPAKTLPSYLSPTNQATDDDLLLDSISPQFQPFSATTTTENRPHVEGLARRLTKEEFSGLTALLTKVPNDTSQEDLVRQRLQAEALVLEEKLATFGVLGRVIHSQDGPVVNVHEFEPAPGIKVSKVIGLQEDLALGLKAQSVLMAPQSGKSTIGIEIPSSVRQTVGLRDILESEEFRASRASLPMGLGALVDGRPLIADLASMPHLLIAGATGAGKSVGINVIILSLIMNFSPRDVRLILVDPKMLELSVYDGIGHLLMPVVTEPQKAAGALKWAISEMERRYRLMKSWQVRNISSFNIALEQQHQADPTNEELRNLEPLPYMVIVIDELCDLMMTAPRDVEDSVQRLAQKARAAGIHLVLATQRPSVDVLTGVIKANLPCRLSFQVASKHDSRTIIETIGAERLLGKGDMLFLPPGTNRLQRAQCAFVGDAETARIVDRLREIYPARYNHEIVNEIDKAAASMIDKKEDRGSEIGDTTSSDGETDEETLYRNAVAFATDAGTVSTSSIQREYRIGYNKAARLMDRMVKEGIVGPSEVAGKPRPVLLSQNRRDG